MTITHIMLDLETWGKRPGCDLRSIGAVVFDPIAGIVRSYEPNGQTFYCATDNPIIYAKPWTPPQGGSEIKPWYYIYKLNRDPETIQWWNDQSSEAQSAFENPIDLREACAMFSRWYSAMNSGQPYENIRIWANDPHFDISILEAVYHAVNLPVPWHYRAPRSVRTVVELATMTRDDYCNYGDAHNALHDAVAQAMTVCKAYGKLGLSS